MKLFGSSNVSVDLGFLHAGYVSAYPRPYGEWGMPVGGSEPSVQLDLVEALRLQSESLAGALPEPSAVVGMSGSDGTISYLVA
ncbi:MAG: hypothetical protein MUC50_23945, partial [Myxococcota bacterium]|nr:hypothetical protein [Myxococcota bacterium]